MAASSPSPRRHGCSRTAFPRRSVLPAQWNETCGSSLSQAAGERYLMRCGPVAIQLPRRRREGGKAMTTWPRDPSGVKSINARALLGVRALWGRLACLRHGRQSAQLRALAPVLVVALALTLTAWVYYVRWGFEHRPWGRGQSASAVPVWLAFNDLGHFWASSVGDEADAVPVTGYDGQFYYYLAQNPCVI